MLNAASQLTAFLAVLACGVIVVVLREIGVFSCDSSLIKDAAGCAEFWLNRYQTLIGAVVAVCAALYAGYWVKRQLAATGEQIKLQREQNEIVRGLEQPSFWLETKGDGEMISPEVLLFCENWNRHPVEIVDTVCVEPMRCAQDVIIVARQGNGDGRVIRGTNPRSEVVSREIYIVCFGLPEPAWGDCISLEVSYRIAGSQSEVRRVKVSTPAVAEDESRNGCERS